MVDYYTKIQKDITDLTNTSATGGLIWSLANSLQDVYAQIDEIKKQSYVQTAEGQYLDSLIYGTFGLPRNIDTRASGYVVMYASSPLQSPQNLRLWCADYDSVTEKLTNTDKSIKFITAGTGKDAGRVFTLVTPYGADLKIEGGQKYIDLTNKYVQFIVVPVVSMLTGDGTNVAEGSIRVIANSIEGITGVLNTYSPIDQFFSSSTETPIQDRVTSLISLEGSDMKVVNAYNFSGSGIVGVNTYDGRVLRGYYQGTLTGSTTVIAEIVQDIKLNYTAAYTKTITLDDSAFSFGRHQFVKKDSLGRDLTYTLVDCWFGEKSPTDTEKHNNLKLVIIGELNLNTSLIVRQTTTSLDKSMIYDPDNVMSDSGVIIDSAQIGGGSNVETDDAFRVKLTKYLASLGKATPIALESGALSVPGITFAQTLPGYMSPRGTTTLLVSGDQGSINSYQINNLKNLLDRDWKAAGINLIIKTPEKVELTVMCRISVKPGYPESLIEPEVTAAIVNYFANKNPGDTISYTELTGEIRGVEGVLNIWNVYIGRKLSDYVFKTNILALDREKRVSYGTKLKYFGYKASLVQSMFNISDIKYTVITGNEIAEKIVDSSKRYKIFSSTNGIMVESSDGGMTAWNAPNGGYLTLQGITNIQDFENYLGYSGVYDRLGSRANMEVTRHLTEPLALTDNLSLPINYEDVPLSSMKPYQLGVLEVPIIATFSKDQEIIPLVGIEIVK